ncbi:hypothetical protein yc1106_07329 [Curvularia clavata]|uniref:Uncharacterized protein n=1 Tax=Curvularia clavata TaxID=95742 RepID=A0A9Q8ZD65_CURCL|nr:hypothetical protein yc1106_07329 [Curvularia clavata]
MSFGLGHHHHHRGSIDMSEISDIKLRGHGRRRSISSPCPPPPPSTCPPASPGPSSPSPAPPSTTPRDTSPLLPPSIPSPPRDPIYRTQIIQPPSSRSAAVRETTRVALRTSTQANISTDRRPRQNLRRVAGYQVLGRQVPWDWDCAETDKSLPSNPLVERFTRLPQTEAAAWRGSPEFLILAKSYDFT